jgi:hypothetical protein
VIPNINDLSLEL